MGLKRLVGCNIVRLDVVDSTNEKAKELLEETVPEGTVVLAGRQASGRGRYGRAWASPPGGLYLSIILKPEERNANLLSLLSGLPVARAIGTLGVAVRLKWPNDIVIGDKKVGGILCEGVYRHDTFFAIVGIGVNTANDIRRFPPDLAGVATTLRKETGRQLDNDSFLSDLIRLYDDFYRDYKHGRTGAMLGEYRKLCTILGTEVVVETAKGIVRGTASDISAAGALVILRGDTRTEIFEGTVR